MEQQIFKTLKDNLKLLKSGTAIQIKQSDITDLKAFNQLLKQLTDRQLITYNSGFINTSIKATGKGIDYLETHKSF